MQKISFLDIIAHRTRQAARPYRYHSCSLGCARKCFFGVDKAYPRRRYRVQKGHRHQEQAGNSPYASEIGGRCMCFFRITRFSWAKASPRKEEARRRYQVHNAWKCLSAQHIVLSVPIASGNSETDHPSFRQRAENKRGPGACCSDTTHTTPFSPIWEATLSSAKCDDIWCKSLLLTITLGDVIWCVHRDVIWCIKLISLP